ncbi:MAG TPA: hypothetical protein VES68_00915, partial [Candidatus Sulfotelmatobacter sp.]|nr:hypothetical protein [Candidatus Sulfotelmatobacter sp.]
MNKELLTRADELWSRTDKADRFGTKFNTYPFDEGKRLVTDFHRLSEEINSVSSPKTEEEVHSNELKRRLYGEAVRLDHAISGHYYTFEDVISLYGIDKAQDIDELRGWLEENREVALETIDKVYGATHALDLRLPVPGDIPTFRRQAEEFAGTHIGNYHKKLAKLFEGLTPVGNFLRDITAVPTTSERSYFHPLTRTLALEIPGICYITEDQTLHINEATLLELFGHEGMGHGLNNVVTSSSNLPNFLKRSVSES